MLPDFLVPQFALAPKKINLPVSDSRENKPGQVKTDTQKDDRFVPFDGRTSVQNDENRKGELFPDVRLKFFANFTPDSLDKNYLYHDYRVSLSLLTSAVFLFSELDNFVFGNYLRVKEDGGKAKYVARLTLRSLELLQAGLVINILSTIVHEIGHATAYTSFYRELNPTNNPAPWFDFKFNGPLLGASVTYHPIYQTFSWEKRGAMDAAGVNQSQLFAASFWRIAQEQENTTPIVALAAALPSLSFLAYAVGTAWSLQKIGKSEVGLGKEDGRSDDFMHFEESARENGAPATHFSFALAGLFELADPQLYQSVRCVADFLIKGKRICKPSFLEIGNFAKIALPKLNTYLVPQDRFYGVAQGIRAILKIKRS